MALVHSLELPHLPNVAVNVAFFDQVANAADLRRHLLDGNPDYEYAFLDVTTILSTTHVLAAVFRAVNDALHNRLRSRNVHSEVVFCLSPNNNIAESFRRFGIQDSTQALLAIKITSTTNSTTTTTIPPSSPPSTTPSPFPSLPAQAISSHLTANVHGTPLPFTDAAIAPFTDLPRVRKIYKLDAAAPSARGRNPKKGQAAPPPLPLNGVGGEGKGDERAEMEASVLGMMALRGS